MTTTRRPRKGFLQRLLRPGPIAWLVTAVLLCGASAWAGVLVGRLLMEDQPSIRNLQHHSFALSSKVMAADGQLIYSFAEEKRDYVEYADISPWIVQGLVAVEDEQFWEHRGLNYKGITRAAVKDAQASLEAGRLVFPEGGSSITQQLAKQLFLTSEKKIQRKINEALLALQIEKNFEKEEILELYLNKVFLGHGRHGVEAASQYYFGRSAKDLTLPQAALIAGLPQRPSGNSPRSNPEAALARRNHVLDRMAEVGYLAPEEAAAAKTEPLGLVTTETERRMETQFAAPFFVEDIRRQLVERFGEKVNTGGLEIETTLDMGVQRMATLAVRDGLRALDKEMSGFRPIARNVVDEGVAPEDHDEPAWLAPEVDDVVPGVVLSASSESARVRFGDQVVEADRKSIAWTRRTDLDDVFRRGDVAPFRLVRGKDGAVDRVELEQDPLIEGALVAIDPSSGEVLAMVGGYDYLRSEFNKVSQARRQVGSAFKPVYYAAALEAGLTPATTVTDEPTVFIDPWSGQQYAPRNYEESSYAGRMTLRTALEESSNVASVRLLNFIGYDRAIDLARRSGITASLHAYPSLALGAEEITLLEITSAFAVFPNDGLHVTPTLVRRVRDAKGNVLHQHQPEIREVMSPATAFQMTQLLRGVVQHGTGTKAKTLGRPVAGKTGTTDDYSNAWFIGFTPSLAVGVWVGHEEDVKPIGPRATGARAALPIWIDFLRRVLEGAPVEQFDPPPDVEFVAIDRRTGFRAGPDCPGDQVFLEAFAGTNVPLESCGARRHEQVTLPACLQRFGLDENGILVVDQQALLQLEEEVGSCPIVVDPIQRLVEIPWSAPGSIPRAIPYRLAPGLGGGTSWDDSSVEGLMSRDPRELRRTGLAGLRDFDVLEGRTVIIVRNDRMRTGG